MPNLLATPRGRLTAFFFLYVTEGIPFGFTSVAVVTQMRREGLGPDVIGGYTALLYLPWSFKYLVAPFVDLFYCDRLGRRRMWIVACQVLMTATLLAGMGIDYTTHLWTFSALLLVHNAFSATQDVAIDALAVGSLSDKERGLANGLMFGGANVGNAIGGSGSLFLTPYIGFRSTFLFVAAAILSVTVLIALPLREPLTERSTDGAPGRSRFMAAVFGVGDYALQALRAFFGSRATIAGLIFALLPAGAYALGLSLQSALAVDLGMNDSQVATLALCSTITNAICCVLGGLLSDWLGRRRMMAIYLIGTTIPTLGMAYALWKFGWIMPLPKPTPGASHPLAPADLILAFWIASIGFNIFNGLLYGTRTALFMDICTPAVAATQFTAYMALLNFVLAYSSKWQGAAAARFGYPTTLVLDAAAGLFCLSVLPWMRPATDARAETSQPSLDRDR